MGSPYKGKFYPQLARALLNICQVPTGGRVLDPFAGCGTTILEAALLGIRGIGLDANPLATLVSETKLRLLGYPVDDLKLQLVAIREPPPKEKLLADEDYLVNWFPAHNLRFLRQILTAIEQITDDIARDAAMVVLSSVLRRGSYQKPNQLRVYRREGDEPESLEELFTSAIDAVVGDLEAIQSVDGLAWQRVTQLGSEIIEADSRNLSRTLAELEVDEVDAVITSPPYANALPYVDTDRLSLRALDCSASAVSEPPSSS